MYEDVGLCLDIDEAVMSPVQVLPVGGVCPYTTYLEAVELALWGV